MNTLMMTLPLILMIIGPILAIGIILIILKKIGVLDGRKATSEDIQKEHELKNKIDSWNKH